MNPNRDNITRMASEAGMEWQEHTGITGRTRVTTCGSQSVETIERFAALVIEDFLTRTGQYLTNDASREAAIAEEREACAKVCEPTNDPSDWTEYARIKADCAATIRARGQV